MTHKTKRKLIKVFFCLFFLVLVFAPVFSIYAEGLVPCGNEDQPACTLDDLLYVLIPNVLKFLIYTLVPILAVIWFVFAGYKMITSGGNPSKFNEGKNMIIYGAVGILLVLSAYVIVEAFLKLIGAKDWVFEFMNSTK
ncbi:MAG: pilin [Candidatus Paceibacterota bacterium]